MSATEKTSQQHLDALMAAAIDRYQHSSAYEAELEARKAQAARA